MLGPGAPLAPLVSLDVRLRGHARASAARSASLLLASARFCAVQVDDFRSKYQTCESYCAAVGRSCSGAWEDEHDTCVSLYAIGCDETHDSSDALCECGPPMPPFMPPPPPSAPPPPPPPLSPGECVESIWPDVKNGLVCGPCKVLVRCPLHKALCRFLSLLRRALS